MKSKVWFISFIIVAVWLTSCALLPDAGNEQATDGTDVPIAAASSEVIIPPTETPIPTNTPLPTLLPGETPTIIPGDSTPTRDPNCVFDAAFVYDVSVPDDSVIPPGVNFDKTWRILNNGTCRWLPGTDIIFTDGTQMGNTTRVPTTPADPGEVIEVSVKLLSPMHPGTYTSYWHLQMASGEVISTDFYTRIIVPIATATRPPRPTRAATSSGESGDSAGTSTPTAVPTSSTWQGNFYANTTLSGSSVLQRSDSSINFNWGTSSPSAEVPSDNFSATWTRTLDFELGTYRFSATADDGVRVYVDGSLVIDEWHDATSNTYRADVNMTAGSHTIKVDYYEGTGDAKINVFWSKTTSSTSSTWSAEYFSTRDLSGAVTLARNDTAVNFDWGKNAPDSSIPVDGFSVRWTRSVTFNEGNYEFKATMDDGMRVYIDGNLVLNEWNEGGKRSFTFNRQMSSGAHTIIVEYFEFQSDAVAKFTWEESLSSTDKWKAEFFNNTDLSGSPVTTREYDGINFDWGQQSPVSGVNSDNFSIRFTREIDFSKGEYKFFATADDGVRVYVDGVLVIDEWNSPGADQPYKSDRIELDGVTRVVVEYYDLAVSAHLNVYSELKD